MKIFGEKFSKDEILKRVGDISQICDVKSFEYNDGPSKGIRAIGIKNISGLDFSILLDRSLDISSLYYGSLPIYYKTKVRETSPAFFDNKGLEFLRTFNAGFLTTGGLSNTGWPCVENDEEFGLHGRISNTPAERVNIKEEWEADEYKVVVEGKVREAKFFGDYLELSRKITTYAGKPKIIIQDTVQNIGFRKSPIMILYHFNFGFPFLDHNAKVLLNETKIEAGTEETEGHFDEYKNFIKPVPEFAAQLFYHDIKADKEGKINIAVVNEKLNKGEGIGIAFKFNKDTLPCVNQMKNMAYGEYICSIEPGSNFVRGRKEEKERGNLQYLEPGESKEFKIEIDVLESNKEIIDFKENNM